MKLYDCLFTPGRKWEPSKPFPGMEAVLVDGQRMYAKKPNTGGARDLTRLDHEEARTWPKLAPGAPCIVNIEQVFYEDFSRPVHADIRLSTARQIAEDFKPIRATVDAVRSGSDGAPVGFYGFLPTGYNVFNSVITGDATELFISRASNDTLAHIFGDCLDMLCPSLYVNSTNIQHWIKFATWQVHECRRIGDLIGVVFPIVPFISPEIHPSAGRGLISLEFWETQIAHLSRLGCDGAVLWAHRDPWATMLPYARRAVQRASRASE